MNRTFQLSAVVIAAFLLPAVHAANLSKDEHSAGKTSISASYKSDKAACDPLKANAKDICVEEAKAKEKVGRAELEFNYTGKAADNTKVMVAKAESAFAVAKERCDDKTGNDKDVCVKEAKAIEVKSLAQAKAGQQMGEARSDAASDMRDADYKVAVQKCESMSGDPKAACMAAAKSKFGKS